MSTTEPSPELHAAQDALRRLGYHDLADELPIMRDPALGTIRNELKRLLGRTATEHHADIKAAIAAIGEFWAWR